MHHGDGGLQMLPARVVVACPNRHVALAPGKKRAGKDEGAAVGVCLEMTSVRGHRHEKPVHIVVLPVLHIAVVNVVPWHADLGPIEHAGLVHIVPGEQMLCSARVHRELLCPVPAQMLQ